MSSVEDIAPDPELAPKNVVLPADPYQLRKALKSSAELAELRLRRKGKRIQNFHERQNFLIQALLKPIESHSEQAKADEDANRLAVKIAIWGSLLSNALIAILQLYAAISSGSLSLLATCVDSVFDLGSNLLLLLLHTKSKKLDIDKWPVGGARLETIGNIVYGFLMGAVNLIVIVGSIEKLLTKSNNDLEAFHIPSIVAVAVALGIKLILFIYCFSIRHKSSQVHVLWEDHRNDLWINGFGILMSTGGSKLAWFLDPMGALIVATGVIISWGRTIYDEFELLAGKSAPYEFLQLLIYNIATFSDDIVMIDTVRAYHSGPAYFVEIDIVMHASTPLWKAHDLSQKLQNKLELLPNVERAFIHVDCEAMHRPEHHKVV